MTPVRLEPAAPRSRNTKDRLCINYACITFILDCASDFNVNLSPAMIDIKISSPHDRQCKKSISVKKVYIKVTYEDV